MRTARRAGILLDFDGSLAEIVDDPAGAEPVADAATTLASLVDRYAVVAIVTGRRGDDIAARLPVDGLTYLGSYGLEEAAADAMLAEIGAEVEAVAAAVAGTRVEHKGPSIAVHYRLAADPEAARRVLAGGLAAIAARHGLRSVEGKSVLELVPVDRPLKGGAVRRIVGERALDAVLFAGDDVADLEAFEVLDHLGQAGLATCKVAVLGPETPPTLAEASDVTVADPTDLVRLLGRLA